MQMNGTLPEGTLAVVFTDIEGSTRLLRALGDRFDGLLARHHALMREAISAHGGVEVSTEGDAFLVVFERPTDALLASVAAQRLLRAETWPNDAALRVRIGIHLGEIRRGGDNYTGIGVHQASRVVPAAHGGQVIVSGVFAAAVGGALPDGIDLLDLGAFHLRDFEVPEHLFQVVHDDLERDFPPPRVASAAVHNLAPARTSFVGRSVEIGELVKATDSAKLVTIVGPGGVGKTRLASEVGLCVAGRYPEGVWLVPLASIESSYAVAEKVKTVMGLVDNPGQSAAETIAGRLASGPGLIILDNCEHVLDGCVELVETLLTASAETKVLATSRETLRVAGEEVVRLGPLDLPAPGNVGASGAVELFVARGAQARRGFELTADNADVVASICRRLDGIPLALELAAARLSRMGVAQVLARLDDALAMLGSGRRGGEERQRTLRATLEWSHRLLSPEDQVVFRGLSVFRGDFGLGAAEALLGISGVNQGLENLVAQSLVEVDPDSEPPRYRLLETIRAYADERLRNTNEGPMLADRHAAYYASLAHDCAEEGATVGALDRLAADHTNLLEALEHLAGPDRPIDHGNLLVDLAQFWRLRGHWQLARQQYLRYLARADRDRNLEGLVLGSLGGVSSDLGDYPDARARYQEALAIARQLNDPRLEGSWAGGLGNVAYMLSDYSEARAYLELALSIAREIGDRHLESRVVGGLGRVATELADYPEGRVRLEQALEIHRELGDRRGEAGCLSSLGTLASNLGAYPEARARFEEALGIDRELGDRSGEGGTICGLGNIAVCLKDYGEARARYEEASRIAQELGNRQTETRLVANLGFVAYVLGNYPEARARYEEALCIARELGDRPVMGFLAGSIGDVATELGDYAEARTQFQDAIAIFQEFGMNVGVKSIEVLEGCAILLVRAGRCDSAAELLGAADSLNTRVQKVREASDQSRFDAAVNACIDRLGEKTFNAAFKRGSALDSAAAAAAALKFLGHV
ncbi:MAG: tetratricopeptide repeat protein [Candidatus Dormibacteraeota bacterium]|nr:tetratricopeptide repeat protein [Candidatus Dormibacteraeota bacterium]